MADQNGDMITSEEQMKQEDIGTTSLLESEIALEPKTTEASSGTEEFSTSTTTVVSEFSSHELKFDSGKDDFPAQVTSTETSQPFGEDFLLFDQQTQQSELQNTNDLFSNDNPPLFQSETLQPEQAQDKEQVEVNKEDDHDDEQSRFPILFEADQNVPKSDKDFLVDFTQGIEPKSAEISPELEEENPDSFGLEETELTPNVENQLKNDIQEPSIGDQTELSPEVSEGNVSEPNKASPECEEDESAPVVLLQQSDKPEYNQGEQQHYEEEEEMPIEPVEDIANESEQKDNESPEQVQSYNSAPLEEQLQNIHPVQSTREELESPETTIKDIEHAVSQEGEDIVKGYEAEVETETIPTEEEHLEEIPAIQNTREDVESPETAVKAVEHVVSQDEDIGKEDVVQVETEAESVPREEEKLEDIHPVQMTSEKNYEDRENNDEVQEMGMQDMIDISKVSKELEVPDEREGLADEKGQDTSEQGTSLETSPVFESEPTIDDKKECLENMLDIEETRPEPDEIRPESDETPSVSAVVESETIMDEKETLANMVDVEETRPAPEEISLRPVVESETTIDKKENLEVDEKHPEPEEIPSVLLHQIDEPKAEQDKTEKKEAKNVPLHKSAAPAEHKNLTKKTSGTKKEHDRVASTATSKNLTGSKKDEHKAERPKSSSTKPASTKPTKPSSATTTSKAKTVPATAASKRPASAQTHKPIGATTKPANSKPATSKPATSKPATSKPSANLPSKGITKTPTRLSESKKPVSASARPTAKDKKPHNLSSGTQKTDSLKSRPRSAVSTKPTDKTDGKVESAPGPAKPKSLSATTRTTVKKTTTTTRTASGPASKNEVSKTTTTTTSKGGTTTVKKTTESSGRTRSSKETPLHPKPLAANKTNEVKNATHGKPGSASMKAKPASATTKGKPAIGKANSSRPKSPTKGTAKKTAAPKGEAVASGATVHETPTEQSATSDSMKPNITESKDNGTIIVQRTEVIENNGETKIVNTKEVTTTVLENITEPDITAESKDNDTREIHHTEVIEDDGEKKIVHTKEVTETFFENGEQQMVTTEIVVEESA